jgi:hypothetical protein
MAFDELMGLTNRLLTSAQVLARLERAGFADVRQVERTWEAPLRLVAGRRA